MVFGQLRPGQIDDYWPICKEILRPSFRDRINILTVEDYYNYLKNGTFHLWVAIEENQIIGVVVTSIEQGSAMRVCTILNLAGENLKLWAQEADKAVTDFAKKNNCNAIETVTRKGFTKMFPDLIEDGVIYVRILKNE